MALINRCPSCGSRRVKEVVGLVGCGTLLTQVTLLISIIGIPLALLIKNPTKTMKCKKCGAKWTV